MFYWIYDLNTWQTEGLFASVFVGITWLGLSFIRPFIRVWIRRQPGVNDIVGYFLSYFSVIYGLLLGLLAVATYQNLSDAVKTVVREASAIAGLYRDVSSYPEPARMEMQELLREYTRYVIEEAWPLQRKGIIPKDGTIRIDRFQQKLAQFEPQPKGQEIIHAEAWRQFNSLVEHRRMRLYSVESGIPAVLWYTVALGAFMNILLIWMFDVRLPALFFIGGMVMLFTASMLCLIAEMDNPFRGEVSIDATAYKLVYDGLMTK